MNDYVILIHGFWKKPDSMKTISFKLQSLGYQVVSFDYNSRKETIENISEDLKQVINLNCTNTNKKIHFVTHSMGGIVVRYFLAKNRLENLGRVIMLASPNKGSYWADMMSAYKIINIISGPALKEMRTDKDSMPNKLPVPYYEVGIISADADDKVSLESTKIEGMKDHIMIPGTHSSILESMLTLKSIENFLKEGRF